MATGLHTDKSASSTTRASFTPASPNLVQRKCACGGTPGPDGECAQCRAKRLRLQRQAANHSNQSSVPPIVHDVLRSPGQPLDPATRSYMEPRFGHDFGNVRVHTDARAAASARAVNALAYTVGRNVVFGSGQYTPATRTGRALLAHELAHTVQQGSQTTIPGRLQMSRPGDHQEIEADRAGTTAIRADETPMATIRPATTQRTTKLMRAISYGADCASNQEEVESNVSRAQDSAIRWVSAAQLRLRNPESAASFLQRHFDVQASNAAAVGQVRSNFSAIAGDLRSDAFTYHCRPDSDARCQTNDGRQIKGFAYAGQSDVYFCDPFPYQNFFGHRSLIDTLLHEAAHAHDGAFNHDSYEWQSDYPGANPLTNADSYASFARDAALGRPGPALELSVGSLFAAEPQFYIAAGLSGEVGGPALDIFNLKLGARVGYLHGTEQQPTRGLLASDIGLRINPIRSRVYVDVTTGAFVGQNFTDNETMAGIANRITAGYRGDSVDLGLDLSQFQDLVGDESLVVVGVRLGGRF